MHTLAYIGFDLAVSTPRDTSAYIAMTFMARIHRDTSFQSRFGRQRCISMYLTLPCGYIDFDTQAYIGIHRGTSVYIGSTLQCICRCISMYPDVCRCMPMEVTDVCRCMAMYPDTLI
jgi:hypothetical protein